MHNFCVVVVTPNKDKTLELAKQLNLDINDYDQLCQNETIKKTLLKRIVEEGKKSGLNSLEIPKNIRLINKTF